MKYDGQTESLMDGQTDRWMDRRADGQTEIRTDEDTHPYSDERTHLYRQFYGLICGKLSSPSRDAVDEQFQRTFDVLTDIKMG